VGERPHGWAVRVVSLGCVSVGRRHFGDLAVLTPGFGILRTPEWLVQGVH
jgi:hypothetical protein